MLAQAAKVCPVSAWSYARSLTTLQVRVFTTMNGGDATTTSADETPYGTVRVTPMTPSYSQIGTFTTFRANMARV